MNFKDEQQFKEFLRDKYERKKWYREPSEVRKSKSPDPAPSPKTTPLVTPPSKVTIIGPHRAWLVSLLPFMIRIVCYNDY